MFRNKTYSILNILGLAVGIAAAVLIFLWVESLVSYDRGFSNAKHIYMVGQNMKNDGNIVTSFASPDPLLATLEESFPEIKRATRYSMGGSTIEFFKETEGKYIRETGSYVDSTFFGMLDIQLIHGNVKTAFNHIQSAVISESMAERFFGKENPVGKSIQTKDGQVYEVTGVFKSLGTNTRFKFDWLMPFKVYQNYYYSRGFVKEGMWGANWMWMYVELHPSADASKVNDRLKGLISERTDGMFDGELFLYPLTKLSLYNEFKDGKPTGSGYIRTVRLFFMVGLVILLIACINFMNLATARSEKRALEVGVRKTFGSGRMALAARFIRESALITCIALMLAVILVSLCLPAFNQLVSRKLSFDFTSWIHVSGLLGIGVICTLLAGSYPSFYLSSFSPITTLKKLKVNVGSSVVWIRKGLVVFQFATAFILICATTVIYLQIKHAHSRPLGFNKENLMIFYTTDKVKQSHEAIFNELGATGLVENAALSSELLITNNSSTWGFSWKGKDPNIDPIVYSIYATSDFVKTAGMKLKEGKDFPVNPTENQLIINEAFAELMGSEGHAGNLIEQADNVYEIVGIVGNHVFDNIYTEEKRPVAIWYKPEYGHYLLVRIKPDVDIVEASAKIAGILKQLSPDESFDPVFMDDRFERMFRNERLEGKLASLFAALAIFISCLGLFGLSAFSAEQHTREIGVRKVLGAKVGSIIVLLGRSYTVLILVALAIGVPVAWYVCSKYLAAYQYRLPLGWTVFVMVALLVCMVAILTVSVQSVRAATANPVKSIKAE